MNRGERIPTHPEPPHGKSQGVLTARPASLCGSRLSATASTTSMRVDPSSTGERLCLRSPKLAGISPRLAVWKSLDIARRSSGSAAGQAVFAWQMSRLWLLQCLAKCAEKRSRWASAPQEHTWWRSLSGFFSTLPQLQVKRQFCGPAVLMLHRPASVFSFAG